jgi:small-conductance mechanosensitive channel
MASFIEYLGNQSWSVLVGRLAAVIAVWIVVFFLIRYLSKMIAGLDKRVEMIEIDPRRMYIIDRLIFYGGLMLALLITVGLLGLTQVLYSTLTAAGVISIIVGFAAKDVVANFFSGIFIIIEQPFVRGDFIEIGNVSGTVRKVSLRSTEIVAPDGPIVTIPNSLLATEAVINYSTAPDRRVEVRISVPNDSNVAPVIETLREIAASEPRIQSPKGYQVLVGDIREYAVDLSLTCYAATNEWVQVRSDLRQCVLKEFLKRHLELAVPVRKNLYANLAALAVTAPPGVYDEVEVATRQETPSSQTANDKSQTIRATTHQGITQSPEET